MQVSGVSLLVCLINHLQSNYEEYYTPSDFTDMRRQIKNDILRFNILKFQDGASGTSNLVYDGWNV